MILNLQTKTDMRRSVTRRRRRLAGSTAYGALTGTSHFTPVAKCGPASEPSESIRPAEATANHRNAVARFPSMAHRDAGHGLAARPDHAGDRYGPPAQWLEGEIRPEARLQSELGPLADVILVRPLASALGETVGPLVAIQAGDLATMIASGRVWLRTDADSCPVYHPKHPSCDKPTIERAPARMRAARSSVNSPTSEDADLLSDGVRS